MLIGSVVSDQVGQHAKASLGGLPCELDKIAKVALGSPLQTAIVIPE
jgi:hypothetical protein